MKYLILVLSLFKLDTFLKDKIEKLKEEDIEKCNEKIAKLVPCT